MRFEAATNPYVGSPQVGVPLGRSEAGWQKSPASQPHMPALQYTPRRFGHRCRMILPAFLCGFFLWCGAGGRSGSKFLISTVEM